MQVSIDIGSSSRSGTPSLTTHLQRVRMMCHNKVLTSVCIACAVVRVAGMHAVAAAALQEIAEGDVFRMSETNNASALHEIATGSAPIDVRAYMASIVKDRLLPPERGRLSMFHGASSGCRTLLLHVPPMHLGNSSDEVNC